MAQTHEWMFYEVMWRTWAGRHPYPVPWWLQQAFRRWSDDFDGGLFESKEAALASNALYRYWHMTGVKDHRQEALIGQAGEVEPVYDTYALVHFLYEPGTGLLQLPQLGGEVTQEMADGDLPVVVTTYRSPSGVEVVRRTLGTTVGERQRALVLDRLAVRSADGEAHEGWLCAGVVPAGPSGFQRHDRAGNTVADRRLTFLRWLPEEQRVEANTGMGPCFDTAPEYAGVYGNPDGSFDPDTYLVRNPFHDLANGGKLNAVQGATDHIAGLCSAVFAWPYQIDRRDRSAFTLDMRLPVDDFRGPGDLAELRSVPADDLEAANRAFWEGKLRRDGTAFSLPAPVAHLPELFRRSRAQLLILSDGGQIHPGPTVYDSFWIRDSSVEATACALAGDTGLAERQLGTHHRDAFNLGRGRIGPCAEYGFFGREHERNDREWDANGEALWAIGRFDRISGPGAAFGMRLFTPYVLDGGRWLRDNRDGNGLLHSGWSAEHLGEADKPHYWDDLWGLAGLYEAARLAERIGAGQEAAELWAAFDDLKRATAASIRWVLGEQRRGGEWQTYIPTGPADVGRLDSTMIGAIAYFHPTRLYMGAKLGADLDLAFRHTLDTIWAHFVTGGFRHDAAWNAYAPYLGQQLAHALLLAGEVEKADRLLAWTVAEGSATVSRGDGAAERWQATLGAWNEQHAYPIASDFREVPGRPWYMGDMPHGWAAAESLLLLRDILFFEADEDADPHLYVAPGVRPHWVPDGTAVTLSPAPTVFGSPFRYELAHDAAARRVTIGIAEAPARVRFVYPCRFGPVRAAWADGEPLALTGDDVQAPAGTVRLEVEYA